MKGVVLGQAFHAPVLIPVLQRPLQNLQFGITKLKRINGIQLLIGIAGLLSGVLVYLIDRPPHLTYFVAFSPVKISLHDILPNIFGPFGNHFPDFIHAFSFSLITAAIICCKKRGYLIICLSWFLIDGAFELGQRFSSFPLRIIPNWFKGIPFFENAESFFLRGTFDFVDLAAIALGALMAFFVLIVTDKRKSL